MKGHAPDLGWNSTNLGYWERTMDCLGLITKVHGDDATMAFVLEYDLLKNLLNEVCETPTVRLEEILKTLHKEYLPVWTSSESVAQHIQLGLSGLKERREIELRIESDAGSTYTVDSTGANTLEFTAQF
jgi:hypothetical protein